MRSRYGREAETGREREEEEGGEDVGSNKTKPDESDRRMQQEGEEKKESRWSRVGYSARERESERERESYAECDKVLRASNICPNTCTWQIGREKKRKRMRRVYRVEERWVRTSLNFAGDWNSLLP